MRYSDTEVMFLSAVHKNVRALRPYLCSEVEVSVAKHGVLLRVLAPLFKKVYKCQQARPMKPACQIFLFLEPRLAPLDVHRAPLNKCVDFD